MQDKLPSGQISLASRSLAAVYIDGVVQCKSTHVNQEKSSLFYIWSLSLSEAYWAGLFSFLFYGLRHGNLVIIID